MHAELTLRGKILVHECTCGLHFAASRFRRRDQWVDITWRHWCWRRKQHLQHTTNIADLTELLSKLNCNRFMDHSVDISRYTVE